MGCSVDPEQWARENRFTLRNGRRYVAALAVQEALGLDAAGLRRDGERLIERWIPGAEVDDATFGKPAIIGRTVARRERLPGVLPMVQGKALEAWITFSYHGADVASFPWLVWVGAPLVAPAAVCPTEGEWLLLSLVDAGAANPREPDLAERLATARDEVKSGIGDFLKTVAVVGAVVGVGYLIITTRRRQKAAVPS